MVDLLPQTNRVVTSEAPHSSLSGQDIASPYMLLAGNMANAADKLNDYAKEQGKKAGEEAVSADGTQITKPAIPIVGDAAQAFSNAARVTSLNRRTPEIENHMTELRIEHQNDPEGFKAAAGAYTKEYVANVNDPMLKAPLEKTALDTASANYRHVLQATDSQNVQNLLTTSQARLTDINDRSASLARQGLVDSPQYAELHQARSVLYGTLANDPRTGFTPERAQLELKENRDRDVVQQAIGQTINGADNEADVRKALNEKFWGAGSEKLALTPQKRDAAISEGVAAFNNKYAEDAAGVAELRSTVNTYAAGVQSNPRSFDDVTHNTMVAQAAAKGDTKSVAALSAVKTMAPLWQAINNLPVGERAAAIDTMSKGIVPTGRATEAMQFYQERGYSKEQAAGIVGNLIQESGLNPNTVHDNGTGLGIAGHRLERLDAMKAFATAKGKPVTDFRTQLEFIDHELQTSEGATGAALKGARTPEEAARAFINYERPQGWTAATPQAGHGYANRVSNAIALAGGDPTALRAGASVFSSTPQVQKLFFSTVAQLRDQQGKEAERLADDLIDRLKKGQQPAAGQINDIVTGANAGNRPDVIQKVQPVLAGADLAAGVPADGGMAAEAFKAQASAAAAGGAGIIERKVLENARANVEAQQEAFKKDPIGASANSGFVKPNGPLVTSDPGLFAQEMAARQAKIGVVQQRNGNPAPIKAVGDGEAPALAQALTQGDPNTAAGLLGAMSKTLTPDNYRATLSSKPVADAISGMTFSRDPARMGTALTVLDQLWKADPHKTEEAFGKDAIDRMQVWQGLRSSFSDAEIAERFQQVDDPARAAAKKELQTQAAAETEKVTPSDVAKKFQTGIWGLRAITGGAANVPVDGLAANELSVEFKTVRAALRTYGVPADKADDLAMQRMKQSWGPSAANGDQVMKYPPERYYPDIGGKGWIGDAVHKEVEAVLGPAVGPNVGASNMAAADAALKMTPQEKNLYQKHLTNLAGPGGVDNPDGSRSTLYQAVQEHDGKFYSIPTVWNGKRETEPFKKADGTMMDVPNKTALANVEKEGWDKFPSYSTPEAADARYEKMHAFLEKDTAQYMASRDATNHPGREGKPVKGADFLKPATTPNWQIIGITPSPNAASRIATGQPPAYSIVVMNNRTGMAESLRSPTGQTAITFDPTPYKAKYEAAQRHQAGLKATAAAIPSPPIGSLGALLGP